MSKRASVDDCRLIRLPKHERENGNITVVENDIDLPFAVKRVYYLYDVPGGEERGGHSHKQLYQLLVAAGGSFDVILDDGISTRTVTLTDPPTAAYRAGYLGGYSIISRRGRSVWC